MISHVIEQSFTVQYQYPVYFTRDLFEPANRTLRDVIQEGKGEPKILVAADGGVLDHHPQLRGKLKEYASHHQLRVMWPIVELAGGELVKQQSDGVDAVLEAIHLRGIDRHSYVITIGGGALLDAVGYAAAIAHRGARLIRIPTTVLSQNDSGVGVKNAINAFEKKNFLGTFAPPYAVLNDLSFLDTLDARDWRAGMAEAVKVGLIKDSSFFEELERSVPRLVAREQRAMERLIFRCAELHLSHIASGDRFEKGSARPLDFGHWPAHRLEYLSNYRLRHGEAVAIGIALDTIYPRLSGFLPVADCSRILALFDALGFDLWAPELGVQLENETHPRTVLRGINEFREHLGGELTVTQLRGIGSGFEVHELDLALMRRSIRQLHKLARPEVKASGYEAWSSSRALSAP
jgi:3-dehydroquinate synthase